MLRLLTWSALLLLALLWTGGVAAATANSLVDPEIATTDIAAGALITVTTTTDEVTDDGDCSLREAIQAAALDASVDTCPAGNGGDTIYLPSGQYILTRGQIQLSGTVALQGNLTATTILDSNHISRVLYIHPDAIVGLSHLEIVNGNIPLDCCGEEEYRESQGGGILNYGVTTIDHSTIHDNFAGMAIHSMHGSVGADGGGIYNGGVLTITNSTISGNAAGRGAPGWITHDGTTGCGLDGEGGGIANYGRATLENTTVAGNWPGARPGDLPAYCTAPPHGEVGGIYTDLAARTYVKNSILAGNQFSDCGGGLQSLGHNIIETPGACIIRGAFLHWVAYLNTLADNGGATPTHALSAKSPAIDAGDCSDSTGRSIMVDQRGMPRPQGAGCDIGAVESPYTATFAIRETDLPHIAFNPPLCTVINSACNLTHDPRNEHSPQWSPDGHNILLLRSDSPYAVDATVYIMSEFGGALHTVVDHAYQPRWSPDGTKIAYVSFDIHVVDAAGGTPVNLTNSPATKERDLAWSPDGSKLLYHYFEDSSDANPDLYVISADGSQKTVLAVDATAAGWSPDSTQILYVHLAAYKEFHIVQTDGSQRIDISGGDAVWYQSPTWSPDSSRIAAACDVRVGDTYEARICVMNRDGTNRLSFSVNGMKSETPVWAHSGRAIAFTCRDATSASIHVCTINADGSDFRNLTPDGQDYVTGLVWLPDSSKLLYRRIFSCFPGICPLDVVMINTDGTGYRRVTETEGNTTMATVALAPDGSKIVFDSTISGNWDVYVLGIEE